MRISAALISVAAAVVVGVGVADSAAQAATWTYANNQLTGAGVSRDSGVRSSITGGTAKSDLGIGNIEIVTYYPAPGYRELGWANGSNPQQIHLTHLRYEGARSKCYWYLQNIGGEARLTCAVTS